MSKTTRNRQKKLMRKNEVCDNCNRRIIEFYPVGDVIIYRPSGEWKSDYVCCSSSCAETLSERLGLVRF